MSLLGKNVFSLSLEHGTWFSNQFAGLADGRERIRDALNTDLISSAESPGPCTGSEGEEDDALLDPCEVREVRILLSTRCAICHPLVPILLLSHSSLSSDSIGHSLPCKQEVTCNATLAGSLYSIHEFPCNGKWSLK